MTVEVHIEWRGATHRVGRLHAAERSAATTFEYAPEWLRHGAAFAIDPTSLPLHAGPQSLPGLAGAFLDCGPDRWGRVLIERAVRKRVLPQRPYRDLDFALALDDASRIGALRFRASADGPFLAAATGRIPPLLRLRSLLAAATAVHDDTATAADLRLLLGEGSPLGGARPKSAVLLPDGRLAIAKFPKPDDTRDIAAGEVLALALANRAGIQAAAHQLVAVGRRHVAVITRFDRDGEGRIPFVSASTLLALPSGAVGAYTQIADAIRQVGDDAGADLEELWRRLVFSLLVNNTDDHLRNHGFLMRAPGRWSLSPAYDVNPVPEIDRGQLPQTAITEDQATPDIATALAAAPRFGLGLRNARRILREVTGVIAGWRATGRRLRIPSATLNAYATAFEHPGIEAARRLLASRS